MVKKCPFLKENTTSRHRIPFPVVALCAMSSRNNERGCRSQTNVPAGSSGLPLFSLVYTLTVLCSDTTPSCCSCVLHLTPHFNVYVYIYTLCVCLHGWYIYIYIYLYVYIYTSRYMYKRLYKESDIIIVIYAGIYVYIL